MCHYPQSPKTVFIRVNRCLKNEIGPFVPQCLCGDESIMQNKANFKMGNINISTARTKAYANRQRTMNNERYSKQTQSKPISNDQTQFQTHKHLAPLAGRDIATSLRSPEMTGGTGPLRPCSGQALSALPFILTICQQSSVIHLIRRREARCSLAIPLVP